MSFARTHSRHFLLLAVILRLTLASALAATGSWEEWETTSRISTPIGVQVLENKVCRQVGDVLSLLQKNPGPGCNPWRLVHEGINGTYTAQTVCTQPGGLTMQVHATIHVDLGGHSAHGTSQASGLVGGRPFTSPTTQFTSRYLGACTGPTSK